MNLRIFGGRATDAESTVLPDLTSWVEERFLDMPQCRQANDHAVILWVNLPSCGILGVARYEYMITAVSNLLAVHKRNGIALIIHPNRAGQMFDRLGCIWDLLWDLSLACSYMSGHEPCFKRC